MSDYETCPHCGAGRFNTYNSTNCYETTQYACGSECELYEITGEIKLLVSPECYERQLAQKDAEIERLLEAVLPILSIPPAGENGYDVTQMAIIIDKTLESRNLLVKARGEVK